jgi:hypothetical protein
MPPFDTDGKPASFSADEQARIISIWRAVSEDYAAFDMDVTTENPGAEKLVGRPASSGRGLAFVWGGARAGGGSAAPVASGCCLGDSRAGLRSSRTSGAGPLTSAAAAQRSPPCLTGWPGCCPPQKRSSVTDVEYGRRVCIGGHGTQWWVASPAPASQHARQLRCSGERSSRRGAGALSLPSARAARQGAPLARPQGREREPGCTAADREAAREPAMPPLRRALAGAAVRVQVWRGRGRLVRGQLQRPH